MNHALQCHGNSTPDVYVVAFEAIDVPLLVIFGNNDETMQADAFPSMIDDVAPDTGLRIVAGENHGSSHYNTVLIEIMQDWLPSTESISYTDYPLWWRQYEY